MMVCVCVCVLSVCGQIVITYKLNVKDTDRLSESPF